MHSPKGKLTICSRGHEFYRTTRRRVCPVCWPGYYRALKREFPDDLSVSAIRSLYKAGIFSLAELARRSEAEIMKLRGIGHIAMQKLHGALAMKGSALKKQ